MKFQGMSSPLAGRGIQHGFPNFLERIPGSSCLASSAFCSVHLLPFWLCILLLQQILSWDITNYMLTPVSPSGESPNLGLVLRTHDMGTLKLSENL